LPRLRADQRLRSSDRRRGDPGEDPDITPIPITKETAGRQIIVTEPFSTKISDGQAAPKMEERRVRTDRFSAGVQVAQLRQDFGRQAGCHMLLNDLTDRLRDLLRCL
jgi:hypothetical protein